MSRSDAIADIYRQVRAPDWAAPNLDGLSDVLRDLSWLPPGEVVVTVPAGADDRVRDVLADAAVAVRNADRPIALR